MRILFLTKSKRWTLRTLQELAGRGHQVTVVCKALPDFAGSEMDVWCQANGVPVYDDAGLYRALAAGTLPPFDWGLSNTYGRLIKPALIEYLNGRILNFHGAVLPDYRGMFAYNWGIFNGERQWGVTAHYVNERFDEGDIAAVRRFAVDPATVTVRALEQQTQEQAFALTMELVDRLAAGGELPRTPQPAGGRYYSRQDFEALKRVEAADPAGTVARKIHACWCPPFEGAYIERDGVRFALLPPTGAAWYRA